MPSPFDEFLSWLSPDREEAAIKHEGLRKKLVIFFSRAGCHISDELADTTIDRASEKLAQGKIDRSVDPMRYCYGVARNVLHEYWDVKWPDSLMGDAFLSDSEPDWSEQELACLDECLTRLSERNRDLVTRWYQCSGSEKIKRRKEMAEEEGGMNALRLRIFRIRNTLRDCVYACLRRDTGNLMQ